MSAKAEAALHTFERYLQVDGGRHPLVKADAWEKAIAALDALVEPKGSDAAGAIYSRVLDEVGLKSRTPPPPAALDWRDDPAADERWNAGLDYGLEQLCGVLGIEPKSVEWDAATEEVEGDVRAVIGHIVEAKFGEDWQAPPPPAALDQAVVKEIRRIIEEWRDTSKGIDRDHYVRALQVFESASTCAANSLWLAANQEGKA